MFHRYLTGKLTSQDGVSLLAALFFLVVVGLFGLLSLRIVSMGSISASEEYLLAQGQYCALGARELRALYILSGGGSGWDGTSSIQIGRCTASQTDFKTAMDKDKFGNNVTVTRFRIRATCQGEGEAIGRTWEAVLRD